MIHADELSDAVRQILAGEHDSFGTFTEVGDTNRWVQYRPGEINAAYPFADHPTMHLASFSDFEMLEWEANKYVMGDLRRCEPDAIVEWIDRYFREVLQCPAPYELAIKLDL